MPLDTEKSLVARLPVAIREALTEDPHSPLQQWLNSTCHDAYALLRYASTHAPKDSLAIIIAAAAASAVDAANSGQPLDLNYAVPLWQSLSAGRVSTELLVEASGAPDDDAATRVEKSGIVSTHTALGLSRTEAVDDETREQLLEQAIDRPHAVNTALGWFYIDLDVKEAGTASSFARKFLTQWVRTHPEDNDLPILLLRRYLDAARRVGVAGALGPIEQHTERTLAPSEAAWTIAWDEAARAGAHDVCSELAFKRALTLEPSTLAYRRWLFIHGLHEERRGSRHVSGDPVRRELLDLLYDDFDPTAHSALSGNIAALCGSIAARTNKFAPVLREVLPYLPGPATPLMRLAFDEKDRANSLNALKDQGSAGVLLAIRILRADPDATLCLSSETPTVSATPAPTPILDDYESNEDFMREIFSSDDSISSVDEERTAPQPAASPRQADRPPSAHHVIEHAAVEPTVHERSNTPTADTPPSADTPTNAAQTTRTTHAPTDDTQTHVKAPTPAVNNRDASQSTDTPPEDAATRRRPEDKAAPRAPQNTPVRMQNVRTATSSQTTEDSTAGDSTVSKGAAATSPTPATNTPPSSTEPSSTEPTSKGPFDHSIFATLPTEELSDKALVAAENDAKPTVSDALLAAFLPASLRARADQLLAQRITYTELDERAFVRAIEERTELLPESAWAIATLFLQRNEPDTATSWMKRAVKHTADAASRSERYRQLARHCAQHCHDLSQAIRFLEESLESTPADPKTIALLDTIYTRIERTKPLIELYERALHSDADVLDPPIRAQWEQRLRDLKETL